MAKTNPHSHIVIGKQMMALKERAESAEKLLTEITNCWERCGGWPDTSSEIMSLDEIIARSEKHLEDLK